MTDPKDPRDPQETQIQPADPQLTETLALPGAGITVSPLSSWRSPRLDQVPDFPVRNWDRFEFLGFLGQGGMGTVFRAKDRRLGREVAIKFVRLDDNQEHLERFMVEARAQARVEHEHVCRVFEVGEVEGKVFIAMQHIPGLSLDAIAPELTLEQKVIVLRDAALGVHEAHRVGIIHRDLKPSNIMVERGEDGALRTYVMDFGLAREWNQDVTETGSVLGTPTYMSPEQARGAVALLDRRSDVYSLGATFYQVITGRPPVTGSNPLEILNAIAAEDVPPMRDSSLTLPRDLEAITLKCLEKDRSLRYESAKALADDLDRFLSGEPVSARTAGFTYRLRRWLWKHKQLAGVAAVALLAVLAATGSAFKSRRDAGRRERLAQQFTESMAHIESMIRYSALSPLHDIRPDLKAVRAHMQQLQEDMKQAGALANGPGHYALGSGYATLDDAEKAREHLQMAWDTGFREPRVAYALALVLGRQYQERLLEAERLPSPEQREARKKDLEARLRNPTLAFLRQARGADATTPEYLESLMAFYEGRLEEALGRLKALGDDLPWFYEAPLLRGSLLQAQAWRRWNQGERDQALADFEAGRKDLATASASGRSAPGVYAALAELELNVLLMEKYGQGRVEPAFARGMKAVKTALLVQPDHVPSLILQAALLGHYAEFQMNRGERVDELVQEAVAVARRAVEAGGSRTDARIALGRAYYQWGDARQSQNLDPTEPLASGLQALESLSKEKRDYTVENHLGLIHQTWSDFDDLHGKDPAGHLNDAISAYERATRMEPSLLPAWINLGTCLEQRSALPGTPDPEGDLQAALKVLDRAHALNPKHYVPPFVQAKVHCDIALRKRDRGEDPSADFQRSLDANRQALAINPGVPHLHNGIGFTQVHMARFAWETGRDPAPNLGLAQEAYRKAIEVAPRQVQSYMNLGDLLIWKVRYAPRLASPQALQAAEETLQKALGFSPGNRGCQVNQGRVCAVRIELALRDGGDPTPIIARGEGILGKLLAENPNDREALLFLGELRSAAVRWKAIHRKAEPKEFDRAAEPLKKALEGSADSQETLLTLVRLSLARGEWERAGGRNPGQSLAQGRAPLERLLKVRPRWGEALALKAGLDLLEAESLPQPRQAARAKEALQVFTEALALNPNLAGDWKPQAERAQKLAKGPA